MAARANPLPPIYKRRTIMKIALENIADLLRDVYISDGQGWDWTELSDSPDEIVVVSDPHWLPDMVDSLWCNYPRAMCLEMPMQNNLINAYNDWLADGRPDMEDDLDHRYCVAMVHTVKYDRELHRYEIHYGVDFWWESRVFYFASCYLPEDYPAEDLRDAVLMDNDGLMPFIFSERVNRIEDKEAA